MHKVPLEESRKFVMVIEIDFDRAKERERELNFFKFLESKMYINLDLIYWKSSGPLLSRIYIQEQDLYISYIKIFFILITEYMIGRNKQY